MKKVLGSLLLILTLNTGFSQGLTGEFNNSFRPVFEASVSAMQLDDMMQNENVILLDVRLNKDFMKNPIMLPNALYKNPENMSEWIGELDTHKEVVVYCIAGKWVSQKVAYILNEKGFSVRILSGGQLAWEQYEN